MKKKQKSKNFLIFRLFLFGVTLFLWNCTLEDNAIKPESIDFNNVKTVSFKDAIALFNSKKEKIKLERVYAKGTKDELEVTPDWNTLEYNEIAYTNAQLTTANSEINRNGQYNSQIYFISVNNHIRNVVFTIWKDDVDKDGSIINGRIYFNDLKGKFIDGYRIEKGVFTKRFVVKTQTQQASFLPLLFFQSLTTEGDCWNSDTLGDFDEGVLDEVTITASGVGNSDGSSTGSGYSNSYNWYYTSGPGSTGYGNYVNGATSNGIPTGGSGGTSLSSGQVTSAAAAILMASPVDPDEEGKCPEGYKKNPTTGKCDSICSGGKIYDTATKECNCPEGKKEDENGNCVDDCDTSKEDLKKVFPNMPDSKAETLAKIINDKGRDFGIDSDEDLWHFLAQAGHETGGFNKLSVTESTYWTTASKLAITYSKFTMDSLKAKSDKNLYYAPDYLKNSSGVANIAMCCKFGNGNVASGDGYKYRGRGIFQLTWKDNYKAFKTWYNNKYDPDIDPVSNPNIIASNDTLAVLSGLWYYKKRVVDKIIISSLTSVSKVTKPINPKLKGLKDRKKKFQKAKDSINCK
ncbi:hypothetical protein BTO04_04175 [Polaribacter sp. SA4-10]|uniref:hypothetical protein n=1 Tax=Polaribacter sp. SA4-10 TaxID=754397 RepID=UPI000B3C9849|nr:hypothetical protein [Polaribacter sp. SA4-10]ARV05944.1 hypothetical protein BTO04_04175 [Polaribacter sp. SA4-10]